jgi:hypothetical protein
VKTHAIKSYNIEAYNWIEDVGPELLKNLNELLEVKGIEPLNDLHGGSFLDGKWVGVLESHDYRNYWHAYIELWGERLHNDNYQAMWFPEHENDEEWDYCKEQLREWANGQYRSYEHTDPNWTDDLVTAMRKLVTENFPNDERIVFWWSW